MPVADAVSVPPAASPEALAAIGWTASLAAAFAALSPNAGRPARIVEQHRDQVRIDDGDAGGRARTLGALMNRLVAEGDALTVGDWVRVVDVGGSLWVDAVLPRATLLQRSRAENGLQRIAANVDVALLVMALDNDYSPNRLDRYLLLVQGAGVQPVVVLTKPDRAHDLAIQRAEIAARLAPTTPLLVLDARQDDAAGILAPWLQPGRTLVLLGSSGVGKSTLLNRLTGNDHARTGATRAYDDRGRHTTTARSLHRLPGGACLIDTPGVRELRLAADESVDRDGFDDIARLAAGCRFRDCRHEREPGCAVVTAVSPARLANYRKLAAEQPPPGVPAPVRRGRR